MAIKQAWLWFVLTPMLSILCFQPFAHAATADAFIHPVLHTQSANGPGAQERVLIIGSSVADGWHDTPQGGGFLKRAFRAYSQFNPTRFILINHAVPGLGALKLNPYYQGWLLSSSPQIVVIAWGGLDDAYDRTPMPLFREFIQQEITLALSQHTVVFIVTPPISKASYTQYRLQQPAYLDAEMNVAHGFHNPNVYVFDVFDQMKRYLAEQHQTYIPYMADGWHPNSLGHELAGRLLLFDFLRHLPAGEITFQTGGQTDNSRTAARTGTPAHTVK